VASLLELAGTDELHDDATAKIGIYTQLSRKCAGEGDAFRAVMAAWAADVHVLHAVLWERGRKASTRPDGQFFTVGSAVSKALADFAAAPTAATTTREAVEAAREQLKAAFDAPECDQSVHELLAARFIDLGHLDAVGHPGPRTPDPDAAGRAAAARLAGGSAKDLVTELRQTAHDCMAVAREMRSAGRTDDALRHAYLADMASFEAYLVDAASVVGDTLLVTVDLRWGAAASVIEALPGLPTDVAEAVAAIRGALSRVLGPVEAARLSGYFESVE